MIPQCVVWCFLDGKSGHENQSKGLVKAMKNNATTISHDLHPPKSLINLLYTILIGRFSRQLSRLPKPTHLIAVGQHTHLPMLLAHLWFGGERIVLMRSNWPIKWFDKLLIPEHDSPPKRENVMSTQGVINNVSTSKNHDNRRGIILIGGPSHHYRWNSNKIISQISMILKTSPNISWFVANSRRTPEKFLHQLGSSIDKQYLIDYRETDHHWLSMQLSSIGQIWVTPDSVSMVYEAVTSGAMVGCLSLEEKQPNNRIVKGINELIKDKILTPYQEWEETQQLTPPPYQLNEAQRAANWILNQ